MSHDVEQRIRERAYHLWEAAGRPHGRESEFWTEAARLEHEAARARATSGAKAKPAKAAGPVKARMAGTAPEAAEAKKAKAAAPAPELPKPKRAGRTK